MGFVKTRVKMVDKGSIYTRVKQIDMGSVCTWLKKVHMFWLCTWVKKVDVFHLHESKKVRIHPIWTKFRRVSMCLVWTTIKKNRFWLARVSKMYVQQTGGLFLWVCPSVRRFSRCILNSNERAKYNVSTDIFFLGRIF